MRIFTSSLTFGAYAPTPKSLRFSVVVASKPAAGTLAIGCSPPPLTVTSRVTGLVMPLMVRSPVTVSLLVPAASTLVLLKVASANLAASKKSALFRCSSNLAVKLFRPLSGSFTSTVDLVTSSALYTRVPSTLPKCALGLEKPKWLHWASTSVWVGSSL